MMQETQEFFIDIINLVSANKSSVLLVQAPYEELSPIFEKISFKNDGVNQHIILSKKNIEILLFEITFNEFDGYVQSLEFIIDDKKIFEGYDGMEYGMFSKEYILPKEFKEKYTKKDMCMISKDW